MKIQSKLGGAVYLALVGTILISHCPQSIHSQGRSIDPEIQKKIDDYIQNVYLPESQTSGLGLTIVQNDGELLYTAGYGMANVEKGIPNENSTQFLIASVTKSFTSVLTIKHLHQRFPDLGESVLDTPIRQLLPEANFTLIDRFRSEHATFRDLLAHRVCLFGDDLKIIAEAFNTTEEATYYTRYNTEICGFRTGFQYSNQIYVMTGELAGILASKSYEDAMQDLLNDIGMSSTAFLQRTDDFNNMPSRALPYYVMDNETHPFNIDLTKRDHSYKAAGGLFVPPNDMSKYLRFLLNLGTIDGKEIVPREVMEWMVKPSNLYPYHSFKQSEDDKTIINEFGYGLGLWLSSYDGWSYVQHTGYIPPYSSLMSLYPTQNLGVFTSSNVGPVMADQYVLHAFIFETLRGNPEAEKKAMELKQSLAAKKGRKRQSVQNELEAFYANLEKSSSSHVPLVGEYGSGTLGELKVFEQFDETANTTGYYLEYGRWYKGWLQDADGTGVLFKIQFETDLIQEYYSGGLRTSRAYVAFSYETLTILTITETITLVTGKFQLGLRPELLPSIPWSPDSCGSDALL